MPVHSETLNVSVITAAELRFGAEKAARPKLAELVEAYLDRLAILDWTNEVTHHYARNRTELERSGKPIGNMVLLIASHAVSQGDDRGHKQSQAFLERARDVHRPRHTAKIDIRKLPDTFVDFRA
jgi:predicted nucleic acid-binding protein